jgi:hypothetical protein
MYCTVCDRDSKNRRVCPYCFTPYPEEGASAKRPSMRQTSSSASNASATSVGGGSFLASIRDVVMSQSPVVRWAGAGIIITLVIWQLTGSGDPEITPGVVQSDIIATPIQYEEAVAIVRNTRESALVDIQQDEVFVSYPAASFPVLEAGQLALAQRFTRADEIVEGRKRRIFFYNPNGKLFAQADGVRGVVVVK